MEQSVICFLKDFTNEYFSTLNPVMPKKLIRGLLKIQFSNKTYKPSYGLFEGQTGGKYSDRSIQQVLRNAVEVLGGNP